LFAGHDSGGRAWGGVSLPIETAQFNGVEPFAHLKYLL
jgi:transposase